MVKLDFCNAYNALHRQKAFEAVAKEIPECYAFSSQYYRKSAHLLFGEVYISSWRGIQQGDPVDPGVFPLTNFALSKKMDSVLNMWYLDDCTLRGDAEVVICDIEKVTTAGNEYGQ